MGPTLANSIEGANNINPSTYIRNSPIPSFVMSPVTEKQVYDLFSMPNNKKTSMDRPNNMIKLASHIISPIFTHVYNESIITGIVPNILKISRITPIYKSGDVADTFNYRPISILSSFAKVLEHLVYNQLESYLGKNNILYKYQFGFRKGHSTEQAILELTDNLKHLIQLITESF